SIQAACLPITCEWAKVLWKSSGVRWPQIRKSPDTRSEVQLTPRRNMRFGNSGKLGERIYHS
ncbi:hypothetical protein, partial [Rhizobium acaciae]|uniref:hypothetical protein n=1 Tax=Rhizobium acaciae TaxID=2989736 RepID=UPI003872F440